MNNDGGEGGGELFINRVFQKKTTFIHLYPPLSTFIHLDSPSLKLDAGGVGLIFGEKGQKQGRRIRIEEAG
jgi:hypothetical protein